MICLKRKFEKGQCCKGASGNYKFQKRNFGKGQYWKEDIKTQIPTNSGKDNLEKTILNGNHLNKQNPKRTHLKKGKL